MDNVEAMPLERLEAEITTLAAHIAAATCRWLELIAEFDQREGYAKWGCYTTAHWLNWQCGLDIGAGREKVRVARALSDLPVTRAAFADGQLSYSKVRALTRVATPETEQDLVMCAKSATASQLEMIVRSVRKADSADNPAVPIERYCTWRTEDDGSVTLSARLSPDDAAVVIAALNKAGDALRVSAETSNPVTQADALVAMAETSLSTDVQSADERYQIVMHVDAADLAENGGATTESGFALDPKTAQRLSCDASVLTQIEKDGKPLSVGRKSRVIPSHIRRALRTRDRGCRFPGCTSTRFVDQHHIKHWARGGETSLSNLIQLCRRHHRYCHENDLSIALDGGAAKFRRSDGSTLQVMPVQGNADVLIGSEYQPDVSAETLLPNWDGKNLDRFGIGMVIDNYTEQKSEKDDAPQREPVSVC